MLKLINYIKINNIHDLMRVYAKECYKKGIQWEYWICRNGEYIEISEEEEESYNINERKILEIHVFENVWKILFAD